MLQKPESHLADLTAKIVTDVRKIITSPAAKHHGLAPELLPWRAANEKEGMGGYENGRADTTMSNGLICDRQTPFSVYSNR